MEIKSVFSLLLWICGYVKTKFSHGFLIHSIVVEHLVVGISSEGGVPKTVHDTFLLGLSLTFVGPGKE